MNFEIECGILTRIEGDGDDIERSRNTNKHKKLHKKHRVFGRHGWNIFSIVDFLSYMQDYFTSRSLGQTRAGNFGRSMTVSDSNGEIFIIYICNDLCNVLPCVHKINNDRFKSKPTLPKQISTLSKKNLQTNKCIHVRNSGESLENWKECMV